MKVIEGLFVEGEVLIFRQLGSPCSYPPCSVSTQSRLYLPSCFGQYGFSHILQERSQPIFSSFGDIPGFFSKRSLYLCHISGEDDRGVHLRLNIHEEGGRFAVEYGRIHIRTLRGRR